MKTKVTLIVAMTPARVIGRRGQLPWHLPSDLKRFKEKTLGCPVIMGRTTFEEILKKNNKPLQGRPNIVLTRSHRTEVQRHGGIVVSSPEAALAEAKRYGKEIFVIGGEQVFERFVPHAHQLFLTTVDPSLEKDHIAGDAFFPPVPHLEEKTCYLWKNEALHDPKDSHKTSYQEFRL